MRGEFRHTHPHPLPITHHFDALLLGGMAVDARVQIIEPRPRRFERLGVKRILPKPVERHAQLVTLARIAHIEFALVRR